MRPKKLLSDRWIDSMIFYGNGPRTVRKLAREVKRTRAALREHRETCYGDAPIEDDSSGAEFDLALYRATLPEGDK